MQNGISLSIKIDSKTLIMMLVIIGFISLLFYFLHKFFFDNEEHNRLAFSGGFRSVNESNFTQEESHKKDIEELIISKINSFETRLIITSDTGEKFKLEQELKELRYKLNKLRN